MFTAIFIVNIVITLEDGSKEGIVIEKVSVKKY